MPDLIAKPRGVFSFNYRVFGCAAGPAEVKHRIWKEEGTLILGDEEYEVDKHTPGSGYWGVRQGDAFFADAQKRSAFTRVFEVGTTDMDLVLRPVRAGSRTFVLERDGVKVGTLAHEHFLSRKIRVSCSDEVPEVVQLFCLWLMSLMKRRAARNS